MTQNMVWQSVDVPQGNLAEKLISEEKQSSDSKVTDANFPIKYNVYVSQCEYQSASVNRLTWRLKNELTAVWCLEPRVAHIDCS